MSRCAQTDRLLDAVFASTDLTRSQADHASTCSECARALAQVRRFDRELHRVGAELSPEPMPWPREVLSMHQDDRRTGPFRRRAVLGSLAAVGLLFVGAVFGGQWVSSLVRPHVEQQLGAVANAAALIGAPERGVLVTDDGVIGVRDLGEMYELVLVRSAPGGLEEHVLDTVESGVISVISCNDDELARGDFVWGHLHEVTGVSGPGDYVVRDRQIVVFNFDRDRSMADSDVELVGADGGMHIGRTTLEVERCLVSSRVSAQVEAAQDAARRAARAASRDAQIPEENLRCEDWFDLDREAQLAVTEGAIFEWLIPAVRARQQMPDAPVDDVLLAARESIDKVCHDPANAQRLVTDVVVGLYGR